MPADGIEIQPFANDHQEQNGFVAKSQCLHIYHLTGGSEHRNHLQNH
jgi:hypothetical protein